MIANTFNCARGHNFRISRRSRTKCNRQRCECCDELYFILRSRLEVYCMPSDLLSRTIVAETISMQPF